MSGKRVFLACLALIVTSLVVYFALFYESPDNNLITVSGTVSDKSGNLLEGVSVQASDSKTVLTDNSGYYQLDNLKIYEASTICARREDFIGSGSCWVTWGEKNVLSRAQKVGKNRYTLTQNFEVELSEEE